MVTKIMAHGLGLIKCEKTNNDDQHQRMTEVRADEITPVKTHVQDKLQRGRRQTSINVVQIFVRF